jgi:hypothetical protein
MTWTADASGTFTPMLPATATFTNGSASISMTNSFAANDMVWFTTSGTLPTNFSAFTRYWVSSTGLSGSTFQVSATRGGSVITAGSAGSGTQTANPEQVLGLSTNNGTFSFIADSSNITYADIMEFGCYTIALSGGSYGRVWKASLPPYPQQNPIKLMPGTPSMWGIFMSIRQYAGTARAIPWSLNRT